MSHSPDLNIIFVTEGLRLEYQSWLLASSLAAAHDGIEGVRFISYVTPEWMPELRPLTRDLFAQCGVEIRELPKPPKWAKPYPHGNKIVSVADHRDGRRGIFLDTDMVCMKPLTDMASLPDDTIAAAPEGRPTWGTEENRWERAYAHYDMPLPTARVNLLRADRPEFYPYYNAGFVAFPETPRDVDGKRFADLWIETAVDFDHNCKIGQKRPWLDQITLPLTLARFGFKTEVLEETYNYSLSHRGEDYSDTPDAHILHFHRSRFLQAAPQFPRVMENALDRTPAKHQEELRDGLRDMGLDI